jgi:hypothetical protein
VRRIWKALKTACKAYWRAVKDSFKDDESHKYPE